MRFAIQWWAESFLEKRAGVWVALGCEWLVRERKWRVAHRSPASAAVRLAPKKKHRGEAAASTARAGSNRATEIFSVERRAFGLETEFQHGEGSATKAVVEPGAENGFKVGAK